MNRREMLKLTGAAVAGTSLLGVQALAGETTGTAEAKKTSAGKKVLVIGAHPDDPETACGGTMMLLKQAGWEVVSVYMTRGQGGIEGKSHDEAAAIRTLEAEEACRLLDARPVFMTQIDGNTEINRQRYAEMRELIAAEKPDVVFTHWPIDSHPDHRVCSLLVYDAWRRLGYSFELFYFEVMSGMQTQLFSPTDYVDISSVTEQKRKACHCHVSQNMPWIYGDWHDGMERFRGLEFHCKYAEAFVHLRRSNSDIFP
ncbi:MAG: PIG-L family deacetylase [Bacteroides sp.]|nr:PIG-L family deacetylase [Bacteroides sp.]